MSNNRLLFMFLALLIGVAGLSVPSFADGPVVTDILIDKTDKNAVVARDAAIAAAQRTAFQVLAQKSGSPDVKIPDDKTIALLVQDFEIKNEQLSADRYVAHFTVRFTDDIRNYITIPEGLKTIAAPSSAGSSTPDAKAPEAASSSAAPVTPSTAEPPAALEDIKPRNILILPYLEAAGGKKLLWEDPNPWRDAWQEAGSAKPSPNLTITVPLGDLADVSSGDTDTVWANNYATVEKSRATYKADQVALVVAHDSGAGIDIYLYKNGALEREKSLTGTYNDEDSYKKAIPRVIAALKSPQAFAPDTASAAKPDEGAPTAVTPETYAGAPAALAASTPGEKVTIDAIMNFSSFSQWMETQKRLASITPPVTLEISGITKDTAQFSLEYDGGLEDFKTALAGKGLALGAPVVDVGESALGSNAPTQKTVYELRLAN